MSQKNDTDQETVHAACKRGRDVTTRGQSCDSLSAVKLSKKGVGYLTLQCTKCSHIWTIPVGGSFNL